MFLVKQQNRFLLLTAANGGEYLLEFKPSRYNGDERGIIIHFGNADDKMKLIYPFFGGRSEAPIWGGTPYSVEMFLDKRTYPEITNGKASVYLDEFNMDCWRREADKAFQKYADNPLPGLKISGREYKKKVEIMISTAYDIMSGKIISDVLDKIPIKKDGTFQLGRVIPVFTNGIVNAESYSEYMTIEKLYLCIYPICDEYGCEPVDYNVLEQCSKTRAKMVIRPLNGAKTCLLNADLSVNNIVTKTKNLKDEDINPGVVYAEKTGTEFLCLRNDVKNKDFMYIRYTKKTQKMVSEAMENGISNMDDFFSQVIQPKLDADAISVSWRRNPRKFVKKVKKVFA